MEIYRSFLTKVSEGAAYDDLNDTRVDPGQRRHITLITCENETNDFTELRIGIVSGVRVAWLEGEKSPSAATLYWMDEPVDLVEDEILRCRFTGCTAGDVLRVTIIGRWERIAPPAPAPAPRVRAVPVPIRPRLAWEAVG